MEGKVLITIWTQLVSSPFDWDHEDPRLTIGRELYAWAGVPALPLEVLPGHRKWPVQATDLLWTGVLAGGSSL